MAMVQQGGEGDLTNQNDTEDETQVSENSEVQSSRASSCNSNRSKRNSPCMPLHHYSKDQLMELSKTPMSTQKPDILELAHFNEAGKWDPEEWFVSKRGSKAPPSTDEPRPKRERQDVEVTVHHKRRTSDPRERIKEEKDEIILSPQRRSFGTGCHVIQQPPFPKRPGSPVDNRENDSFRDTSRRIGSGRLMGRDRDPREWERDHREYSFNSNRNERRERFEDDNEKDTRRYSNRYGRNDRKMRGHDRIDEEEPEWFVGGPTSQSETIELVGFEDANEDDKKSNRRSLRKGKETSRRQTQKQDDWDKDSRSLPKEKQKDKEAKIKAAESAEKPKSPEIQLEKEKQKHADMNFELNDLLLMDWIPGLSKESPSEAASNGISCSRFSQWFQRESPIPELQGSGNNSRRSSYSEELLAHVLGGMGESQFLMPSPTQSDSGNYFTPISPAVQHSPVCSILPPHPADEGSKSFLEMLQQSGDKNFNINGNDSQQNADIKEMEAGLKLLVLGNQNQQQQDGNSALNKLFQHISGTAPSSVSVGPFDKSKALQENDLIKMLEPQSPTPPHSYSPRENVHRPPNAGTVSPNSLLLQAQLAPEMYSKLIPHGQNLQHFDMQQTKQSQQQMLIQTQQVKQQGQGPQVFTVDMLAKMLDQNQPSTSPLSPGVQQPPLMYRNEQQSLNALFQQQRQREMLSSMMKPPSVQLPQSQHSGHSHQKNLAKDILGTVPQQSLGVPSLVTGPSPRQSPLPLDPHGSVIHSQGRIPSPLVFGQQPPALSHAPAAIHPNHLQQGLPTGNTLQVQQNPMVMQRVPSPQELAAHTQNILQNALIKRKLEEQKENYRKRLEAQRSTSPVMNKSINSASPLKGLSPTFTPTSVMRKMHSEKMDSPVHKDPSSNGAMRIAGNPAGILDCSNVKSNVPRPLCGQQFMMNAQRTLHPVVMSAGMNSMPSQGRPIVKGGSGQAVPTLDPARTAGAINKPVMTNTKLFPTPNNQYNTMHSNQETSLEAMGKFFEQQRLMQQQKTAVLGQHRQNSSPMPPVAAAAAFGFAPHNQSINNVSGNLLRPVPALGAATNLNFPLFRNMLQANPTLRGAQPGSFNQLNQLRSFGQFPAMQRVPENRQIGAGSRNYHPLAFQQMLLNTQNQVASNSQSQAGMGLQGGHGDGKHTHLMPCQTGTSRQSPVNLTKWFGDDVLTQKMPEMPAVSHRKALRLEDIEQQHSAAVHN